MSCSKCYGALGREKTVAAGKEYHPACFVCASCGCSLPGEFYQRDGQPYCKDHFASIFLPPCASCGQPIEGKEVIDKGRHYHEKCFHCSGCGQPCDKGYFERGGAKYCPNCNIDANVKLQPSRQASGHCAICYKHFQSGEDHLQIGTEKYHKHCFKCELCKRPIGDGQYYTEEITSKLSKGCCESCYARAERCYGCGSVILSGTHTSALGRKYHIKGCFKCENCNTEMPKGTMFVNDNGRVLCPTCGRQ